MSIEFEPLSDPKLITALQKVPEAVDAMRELFEITGQEVQIAQAPVTRIFALPFAPHEEDPEIVTICLEVNEGFNQTEAGELWRKIDRRFGTYLDTLEPQTASQINLAIGFVVRKPDPNLR